MMRDEYEQCSIRRQQEYNVNMGKCGWDPFETSLGVGGHI